MCCERSLVGRYRISNANISKTKNVFKLLKTPSCRASRVLLGNVFKSGKILKRIGEKTIFTKKNDIFHFLTLFRGKIGPNEGRIIMYAKFPIECAYFQVSRSHITRKRRFKYLHYFNRYINQSNIRILGYFFWSKL